MKYNQWERELKDKLGSHSVKYDPSQWDLMEEELDAFETLEDPAAFDQTVKDKLGGYRASNSSSTWSVLEQKLEQQIALRNRFISLRIGEALILGLLLLSFASLDLNRIREKPIDPASEQKFEQEIQKQSIESNDQVMASLQIGESILEAGSTEDIRHSQMEYVQSLSPVNHTEIIWEQRTDIRIPLTVLPDESKNFGLVVTPPYRIPGHRGRRGGPVGTESRADHGRQHRHWSADRRAPCRSRLFRLRRSAQAE